MRVRVVFGLTNKGAIVPFHHQFMLNNLVNSLVDRTKGEFKGFEVYNFSGLKGQTKVGKEGLHFYSNKVTLVISSPVESFIKAVVKALFEKQQVEIGKLLLIPLSAEIEKAPEFKGDERFICISPLVVIHPEGSNMDPKKFLNPLSDQFSDLLYDSTMSRMEQSGLFSPEEITNFYKSF